MTMKNSKTRDTLLDFERKKPRTISTEITVSFDNGTKELLVSDASNNHLSQVSYFSAHESKHKYSDTGNGPDRKFAHIQNGPLWPGFWPYILWESRALSIELDTATKGNLTLVPVETNDAARYDLIGKGNGVDWRFTVDRANGGLISHIEETDRRSKHRYCSVEISYKKYQGNLIYPEKLKETIYAVDETGREFIEQALETQVVEAQLNLRLTERDLEFGAIPVGATVYDMRFDKEIVYVQGVKQLSDREMFQVSKNPALLEKLTLPPARPVYPPFPQIIAMFLIPTVIVLSIIWIRKRRRQN